MRSLEAQAVVRCRTMRGARSVQDVIDICLERYGACMRQIQMTLPFCPHEIAFLSNALRRAGACRSHMALPSHICGAAWFWTGGQISIEQRKNLIAKLSRLGPSQRIALWDLLERCDGEDIAPQLDAPWCQARVHGRFPDAVRPPLGPAPVLRVYKRPKGARTFRCGTCCLRMQPGMAVSWDHLPRHPLCALSVWRHHPQVVSYIIRKVSKRDGRFAAMVSALAMGGYSL